MTLSTQMLILLVTLLSAASAQSVSQGSTLHLRHQMET